MSEAPKQAQSLRHKIFLARKAAKAVAKNGHSADGDFTFARFEDVLAEASKQLEKRGILYVPSMVEEELVLGKQGVIAKAVIEYEVTDTKTGESLKVRWAGTGYDAPGDKALFKATTGTEKYFLARLLGIPFGTDPEAELADPTASLRGKGIAEPRAIDPARVSQICAGINNSSLSTSDVVEMLTELGVEVEEGTGAGRVVDAVKRLSPEQADEIEAHLERRAQDDAALAPDLEPAGVA